VALGDTTKAIASALLLYCQQSKWRADVPDELLGWSSSATLKREMHFELDGQVSDISVRSDSMLCWICRVADKEYKVHLYPLAENSLRIHIGHVDIQVQFVQTGDDIFFRALEYNHRIRDLSILPHQSKTHSNSDGMLRAPMNGRVASVAVQAGEQVQAGQPIVVLEAMKMEHTLFAPFAGTVQALHISTGEQVEPGRILAEMVSV